VAAPEQGAVSSGAGVDAATVVEREGSSDHHDRTCAPACAGQRGAEEAVGLPVGNGPQQALVAAGEGVDGAGTASVGRSHQDVVNAVAVQVAGGERAAEYAVGGQAVEPAGQASVPAAIQEHRGACADDDGG